MFGLADVGVIRNAPKYVLNHNEEMANFLEKNLSRAELLEGKIGDWRTNPKKSLIEFSAIGDFVPENGVLAR